MPELDLSIGGRTYAVACQEGEELHLKTAAAKLDVEATHVATASGGRLPESRVLLMAGLMLADQVGDVNQTERYSEERTAEMEQKLRDALRANQDMQQKLAELTAAATPVEEADTSEAEEVLARVADELEAVADQLEGKAA